MDIDIDIDIDIHICSLLPPQLHLFLQTWSRLQAAPGGPDQSIATIVILPDEVREG